MVGFESGKRSEASTTHVTADDAVVVVDDGGGGISAVL